jgi:hypothetical protein
MASTYSWKNIRFSFQTTLKALVVIQDTRVSLTLVIFTLFLAGSNCTRAAAHLLVDFVFLAKLDPKAIVS